MTTNGLINNISAVTAFRNFIEACKTPDTRTVYTMALHYFMDYLGIPREQYDKLLPPEKDPKTIQMDIRDYVIYLKKQQKRSYATISTYVAAISKFYAKNFVVVNIKDIRDYMSDHEKVAEDRPYTHSEIQTLLANTDRRNKSIILLMCSSGGARLNRITRLSLSLSLLIISTMAVLPHFGTDLLAQTPHPSVNEQITPPLDVADSIYSANTTEFLGSKNISLTPYRMTEEHSSDQGFLKGVGNVTNKQTYISTHLSDELIQSRGNGTFETPDGQSIAWIGVGIGRPIDGRWVFHGIILFNNTQSESLSLLNNSIGLSKDTVGNEPHYIWLLE